MADNSTLASAGQGALQGAAVGSAVPGIGTAIGAIGGGVLGLLGGQAASDERKKANAVLQAQLEALSRIAEPSYRDMLINNTLLSAGKEYNPEKLNAEQALNNYYNNVQADPEMIAQQKQYMSYLKDLAAQGITPDEQAQRNALMRSLEANQQSKLADIQQSEDLRGMGSSGANLVAKLTAQQQAQNQASQSADQLLSQLFQRKMGAEGALNQQAQTFDQTQYQRAMAQAQQKQAIDQFNLQQRSEASRYNTEAANAAQRANLARQYQVSDANVGLLNQQQAYNKNLEQLRFENQLKKAGYMGPASQLASAGHMGTAQDIYGGYKGAGDVFSGIMDYGQKSGWFNKKQENPVNTQNTTAAMGSYGNKGGMVGGAE
jgi:hypothetical protein